MDAEWKDESWWGKTKSWARNNNTLAGAAAGGTAGAAGGAIFGGIGAVPGAILGAVGGAIVGHNHHREQNDKADTQIKLAKP